MVLETGAADQFSQWPCGAAFARGRQEIAAAAMMVDLVRECMLNNERMIKIRYAKCGVKVNARCQTKEMSRSYVHFVCRVDED